MSLEAARPDLNATVAASAGTGKTFILVTRVMRLLLAGADPGGVLAVTFTRKAAGEMLERIHERARDLLVADPAALDRGLSDLGVTPDASTRRAARDLYERLLREERPLRATTFHAFCAELLRRFPLEAAVPAGFELLERTALLEQQAWEALVGEATRRPQSALGRALERLFVETGSIATTRTLLGDFLAHRGDWWAYTEETEYPVDWADRRLIETLGVAPGEDPLRHFPDETLRRDLARFAELLSRHPTRENLRHAERLAALPPAGGLDAEGFAALRSVFFKADGQPRVRSADNKTLARRLGEEGVAELVALHEALCTALEQARERVAAAATVSLNHCWYAAGDALLSHYQRLKREQRVLDFADLEWEAYRLLNRSGHAEWVQYKLDQRIEHLLIDEFQDTNPTQWRLLRPLLEEMAADRARSLFLVGDPKQSIYGFRRADHRLQAAASHWLAEIAGARAFRLDLSYRSAPAVIDLVNRVFDDAAPGARLADFQPQQTARSGLWGRIEVHPLLAREGAEDPPSGDLRDPLDPAGRPATLPAAYREGRLIAARIDEWVGAGLPVGAAGEARPLRYDDVFVLLRKRTQVEHYERALRDAGIPYLGIERRKLLERIEIRDLEALLQLLLTPYGDLTLAQVLRSPLFAAGDEDLMTLARSAGGRAWLDVLPEVAASQPAGRPLRRAGHWLGRWRSLVGRLPVHDLLDRIFSEGDVPARYASATPAAQGARVQANLARFLELALEIDSGRYPSLVRFLDTLETLRGSADAPDETPARPGEPGVRLLTVHAAKGLEAPVVFLADAAAGPSAAGGHRLLIDWPPERARPGRFLLSLPRGQRDTVSERMARAADEREAREESHLLYVALTRARQVLVVTGSEPAPGRGGDWHAVLSAAAAQLPGARRDADGVLWMQVGESPVPAAAPPGGGGEPPAPEPALSERWSLPAEEREIAPSRAGTDEIARGGGDEDARLRGLAVHRFLQWLTEGPAGADGARLIARAARELCLDPLYPAWPQWLAEARAVVADPALAPLFDPRQYRRALAEVPVTFEADGRRVHGIVDRMVLTDERVLLIDYKTHAETDPGRLAVIAAGYRGQLALYAEGARRLWPDRTIETRLLFTRARRLVDPLKAAPPAPAGA